MRVLVVYESMFGNTHLVADAIGRGLAETGADVAVVPIEEATVDRLSGLDLVVVGGPTHVHAMSRESTRKAAVADAEKPDSELHLDADAEGEGLREWFDALSELPSAAAAFDTRIHMPAVITGRASKGIAKRLRRHGSREIAEPESFFVLKDNTLEEGEEQRAVEWGRSLARAVRDDSLAPSTSRRAGS